MASNWFHLKKDAIALRKRGLAIRKIEEKLGIPRSTLSFWFRDVELTQGQRSKLRNDARVSLVKARKAAVSWHNEQKALRLGIAKKDAYQCLKEISTADPATIDLALAILYLGEGFKKTDGLALGNSDPLILKFFLTALRKNYKLDPSKIKCELHLRADQKPGEIRMFWSGQLGLPAKNFTSVSIDKRTKGSKTYPTYKGVCVIRCSNVAIQRKLMYLSTMFCQQVIGEKYQKKNL